MDLELPEEMRPAWELGGADVEHGTINQIEQGWEIRMEDGRWLGLTNTEEYFDTTGKRPNYCRLYLADRTFVDNWSSDLVMSRKLRVAQKPARTVRFTPGLGVDPYDACIGTC